MHQCRIVNSYPAEIIREKLTRRLGAELPYVLTVEIERYEEHANLSKIYAIIWVEKASQKMIVIGKDGEMLKKVGTDARLDIEKLLDQKVYLQLWVKVKSGWYDNARGLQSFGSNEAQVGLFTAGVCLKTAKISGNQCYSGGNNS